MTSGDPPKSETARFKAGLEDVVAGTSSICFLDGVEGRLLYRGYDIRDLAEKSSFAEVAMNERERVREPASVAAEVAVPVDMVEKIAQRVVAQISEKVIQQIAWEVIPDLAEAMIKKEIERLKAELQQI